MHNNRLGPKPPLDLNPTLSLLVYSFVSLEGHSEADFLFFFGRYSLNAVPDYDTSGHCLESFLNPVLRNVALRIFDDDTNEL